MNDFRICLCHDGKPRKIVSVSATAKVQDVKHMAMDSFSLEDNITLKAGYPLRTLNDMNKLAQDSFSRNDRVQVFACKREDHANDERSKRTSLNSDGKQRPTKHPQIAADESSPQWACSFCTLLNDPMNTSCEACGSAKGGSDNAIKVIDIDDDSNAENEPDSEYRIDSPPVGSISLDFGKRGSPPLLPDSITNVSLNVSGLMPSSAAPIGWDPIRAFQSEILQYSPDVVCLQEVPDHQEHGLLPGYECVGTCKSHCEKVALFFKTDWAHHTVRTADVQAPAVLATMKFLRSNGSYETITFASCHLSPFKENAPSRLEETKRMLQSCTTDKLIIAGDFNMRTFEDTNVERLGLNDAWKSAGSVFSEKNTWDSTDHTPKGAPAGSGPHNRYHGEGAFPFKCRFDRIYLRGEGSVTDFRLIANRPLTNPHHYLSDHFGMVATARMIV